MSSLNEFIDCPDFQANLNGYFGENPQLFMEPIVLTSFLQSEMNAVDGLQVKLTDLVSPGNGKMRTVQLTYIPRFLESDVEVGTGREDCTSSNVVGETSQLYNIEETDYIQDSLVLDYWLLKKRCQANADYAAQVIQQLIDNVTRKRESMLYADLATMYGSFSAGEPDVTLDVKSIETAFANGTLNPDGMAEMVTATRYAGYNRGPVVFNGRAMGIYFRKINAGCCSIDGVDIDQLHAQYGFVSLESYRADDAFGDDGFITVNPGAAQILEWSEYEGDPDNLNFIDTPQFKAMPIIDPRTGSKYDMKWVMDCNGKISIFIRSWFKLASLPADAWYVGDRLNGVNWINRFEINNP